MDTTNLIFLSLQCRFLTGISMKPTAVVTQTIPHIGKPLDGSQYRTVIEEQVYAELPPTPQEQMPVRARHAAKGRSTPPADTGHPSKPV